MTVRARRLPPWLTRRLPGGGLGAQVQTVLRDLRLGTVCAGAHCPNQGECHSRGLATFMILGPGCTRRCGFCAVHGPGPSPVRRDEPDAVAKAASRLGLRHVVVTSVTRDDLPDGGASQFAATIAALRRRVPAATVEVLTPDFGGDAEALGLVLSARPDVFNHNVETVPELYASVRPGAEYRRSLDVLAAAAGAARGSTALGPRAQGRVASSPPGGAGRAMLVKSGLMLGLGETDAQVRRVLADLRRAGCDIVTLGQYLAPSPAHLPVARFVTPRRFDRWRELAIAMGFLAAAAGPFVRSSYRAGELLTAR